MTARYRLVHLLIDADDIEHVINTTVHPMEELIGVIPSGMATKLIIDTRPMSA